MEFIQFEIESTQVGIGDIQAYRIDSSIQFGADPQSGMSRRIRNQIDDDFVARQGLASPVLGNVAEHAVLDLVPLAGPRREVAHMDGQLQAQGQLLQRDLPQAAPAGVAAATVGSDQQLSGCGVPLGTHLLPPSTDGLNRELCRVVIDAYGSGKTLGVSGQRRHLEEGP